jgi:membrane-bound ClpP family serine protease
MRTDRSFLLAKIFAWIGLFSLVLLVAGIVLAIYLPSGGEDINAIAVLTVLISSLTLLIAMIGTTSTIILSWRADRRQSEEFKLKIQQLELELAEAREKASKQHENPN